MDPSKEAITVHEIKPLMLEQDQKLLKLQQSCFFVIGGKSYGQPQNALFITAQNWKRELKQIYLLVLNKNFKLSIF